MQIQNWSIDKVIPYARNARHISDAAISKVAASLQEFGWKQPIVVDKDNVIVVGHTRLEAAKRLNFETVPVVIADDLTPAQIKAYRLMDNRSHQESTWDNELLAIELGDLQGEEFDLALTGFDDDELGNLLAPQLFEGLTDENEVPEVPKIPVTISGDIWLLGDHRLMCGDSTSIDAVEKLMDGQKADMVFTDPPYGMSYRGGRGKNNFSMIKGDDLQGKELIALVQNSLATAYIVTKKGAAAYICFPWRTYSEFEAAIIAASMKISTCIVWDKKSFGLGNQDYRPQHEFIFYCKGEAWYGDRCQSDVWSMTRENTADYVHPTQKPVELIERALKNSSKSGDLILDLFGGSGSTLVACDKTSRINYSMEIDPAYCDVIIERWQNFTGRDAVHAETGQTFNILPIG